MKKKLVLALSAIIMGATSLTAIADEPVMGMIYKEAVQPGGGSGSVQPYKVGCAECKSYFGIVALGDCSVKTAMKNGKITQLSHYDQDVLNILGYKTIITKAYGR